MLRTCSDWIFYQDASPEHDEWINQSWGNPDAPVWEAIRDTAESIRQFAPAFQYVTDALGAVIVGNAGPEIIQPIRSIFTDDLTQIEGQSGTRTHDDRGRPVLGPSGGPVTSPPVCARHGLTLHHGWCPRCRR